MPALHRVLQPGSSFAVVYYPKLMASANSCYSHNKFYCSSYYVNAVTSSLCASCLLESSFSFTHNVGQSLRADGRCHCLRSLWHRAPRFPWWITDLHNTGCRKPHNEEQICPYHFYIRWCKCAGCVFTELRANFNWPYLHLSHVCHWGK